MRRNLPDQETLLEAGLAVVAAMLLSGLGCLLFSRAAGEAIRSARQAEAPPPASSVPPGRHRNVSNVATR